MKKIIFVALCLALASCSTASPKPQEQPTAPAIPSAGAPVIQNSSQSVDL